MLVMCPPQYQGSVYTFNVFLGLTTLLSFLAPLKMSSP